MFLESYASSILAALFGEQPPNHIVTRPQLPAARRVLGCETYMPELTDWPLVSWRQFVHEQGGATAWYNRYKGGMVDDSIEAWNSYLQLFAANKGHFIKSVLDRKIALELMSSLALAKELSDTLKGGDETQSVAAFRKKLKAQLKRSGRAYLFIETCGKSNGEAGHAMTIRFERRGKEISISILNLGQGVSEHPVLKKSTTGDLYSYSYFPVHVDASLFFSGSLCEKALTQLRRYQTQEPIENHDYNASEIYDLFRTIGQVDLNFNQPYEILALPLQTTPNCSEVAAQLFFRDNLNSLLQEQYQDPIEIKVEIERIFLLKEYCSLLSAYCTEADPSQIAAFKRALRVFAVRLYDARPNQPAVKGTLILEEDEFKRLQKSVHKMKDKCAGLLPQEVETEVRPRADILAAVVANPISEHIAPELLAKEAAGHIEAPPLEGIPFLSKISLWKNYLGQLDQPARFWAFGIFVESLAIPKAKELDEWDNIPVGDIDKSIEALRQIALCGFFGIEDLNQDSDEYYLEEFFFALHTLYAIVDKLAHRDPKNRLGSFASPFLLGDKKKLRTFTALPDGFLQQRYMEIEDYFTEMAQGRHRIFPVQEMISIELQESRKKYGRARNHYTYAKQFSHGDVLEAWTERIPKSAQTLYLFAFWSQLIIPDSGFSNFHGGLPDRIRWTIARDESGGQSLQMAKEGFSSKAIGSNGLERYHSRFAVRRPQEYYSRKLTTNETVTVWRPDGLTGTTDEKWRILLRLGNEEKLSLHHFIQYLPSHLRDLADPRFRSEFYRALFAPGVLARAKKQDPRVVQQVADILRAAYEEFGTDSSMREIHYFLFVTAVYLESFMDKKMCGHPYLGELISILKLETESRRDFRKLLAQYEVQLPYNLSFSALLQLRALFDSSFASRYSEADLRALQKRVGRGLCQMLEEGMSPNILGQKALTIYYGSELEAEEWSVKAPGVLVCKSHQVDLMRPEVTKLNGERSTALFFPGGLQLHSCPTAIWLEKKRGEYYNADGTFRVITKQGVRHIERQVDPAVWAKHVEIAPQSIQDTFLEKLFLKHDAFLAPDGSIHFYRSNGNKNYILKDKKLSYLHLDSQTSLRLIAVDALPPESPFYPLATRFPFPQDIYICHEEEGDTTDYIHFQDLDLTIYPDENVTLGKLLLDEIWEEYPDALVFLKGGIKQILIPARFLSYKSSQLGSEVAPEKRLYDSLDRYFVYELRDPQSGILTAKGAVDYLYLALLYKMRRNYEMATYYLEQVRSASSLIESSKALVSSFISLLEKTDESYAFNMKLLYLIVNSEVILSKEQFQQRRAFDHELLHWASNVYCDYLATIGRDGVHSQIPAELQLEPHEEAVILRFLHFSYEQQPGDSKLPEQLIARRIQICSPTMTVKFEVMPTKVYQTSKSLRNNLMEVGNFHRFHELREPCAPVPFMGDGHTRYPAGYAKQHFAKLFRQARATPKAFCPFDLTLNALLASNEHFARKKGYLATLLYYVRVNPERFQGLNPEDPELISRVRRLVTEYYSEFKVEAIGEFNPNVPIRRVVFLMPYERERVPLTIATQEVNMTLLSNLSQRLNEENRDEIMTEIKARMEVQHTKIEVMQREIVSMLNALPDIVPGSLEESLGQLEEDAGHLKPLLPAAVMKEVVLKGDRSYLKRHRSALSDPEIDEICYMVKDYYFQLALYQHLDESHSMIEKKSATKEEIHAHMEQPYCWDPQLYPEITYYRVVGGLMPRLEQFEAHQWACERIVKREKGIFQFPAGAGKTCYLRQLFMLRVQMEGMMPVCVTPPAIYPVDRQNLHESWEGVGERLAILELSLRNKPGIEELKLIKQELQRYKVERRALLITPESWAAIKLIAKNAVLAASQLDRLSDAYQVECKKLFFAEHILNFFQTNCMVIVDEAHTNLDPLSRSVMGSKRFARLKERDTAFMVQIMAPLFEDGPIERMAKLLDGPILQAQTPTAATINEIRRVLVERLGFEPHYTPFLLDRKIAAPDTFASLSREEQEKLSITRHFMTELIFQLFEMRTVLDHQRSVYLNEPHQTPARHKTQISAQFHDPLLTAALTVKAAYQQGLSEDDVKKFLIQLIERDLHEREALSLETTSWQSIFDSWGIGGQQLRHINPHDIITVEDVALKIDRNPKAIALYLELVGLREIGYCPEQTSCSPADFVAGCDQGLYFSATPGPQFTYPLQIDKWREASEFEEQVVLEASHRRNSTIRSINSLDAILSSQQNNVVIDPEGYLNIENRKFASRWIQMAPNLQAVIFFNKGQLTLMKNTHHCFPLLGSDSIEKQLRKFGLSLTNKGVGVYFDVEHCEAANIPLPPDSAAAVLIPEKSTRSRVIQGVMRMRGFLKVDSKQRVTWLTDESYGGMSVAEIFEQLKINESQGISLKRAKMAAFSEVARIVAERYEQEKREKLGPLLRTAPNLMQYCLEHINGIIELKPQDYVQSYASREHEIPIEESLMHFAQKLHRAYYDKEMEISEIEAVIARVQPVVPTISSSAEQEGAIHMQQNMEEMMEVHQAELKPRAENPLEAKHSYGELKLVLPEFFEEVMNFEKASSYYEWTGFLPAVHLDRNHTETASLANEPGVRLIKSIESFLIIEKEGQLIAYVTSDDLSKSYAHQMRRFKSEASSHRAILISALSGTVMERGREGSGIRMSDEQIQALLEGEWLKKLRVHAALARGEFLKPSADLSLDDIEREIRELQEPESCFAGVLKRQIDRTFAEEIKKRQLMQRMSDIVTATIIK